MPALIMLKSGFPLKLKIHRFNDYTLMLSHNKNLQLKHERTIASNL